MMIEKRFTKGDRPEVILKKLHEFKQGQKDMEEFLLEFENLRALVKITKEHALEILQHNAKWSLTEKAVMQYGPPVDYDNLRALLVTVGTAEQSELENLIDAEVRAATERASAIRSELAP